MRWGRGGMVGVRKAIYAHEKAQEQAAAILVRECGVDHRTGDRADLCPMCQAHIQEMKHRQGNEPNH